MRASDFSPPPHRPLPAWVRYASFVALYGLGVPLVKTLELLGKWPSQGFARRIRATMGEAFGDYVPTASDVIVCSFFKSGTTWLLQMATQVAYRGQAEFEGMRRDHPGTVRRIAELMRVDLSPEELESVIHQSSFAVMRAAEGKFEPGRSCRGRAGARWCAPAKAAGRASC